MHRGFAVLEGVFNDCTEANDSVYSSETDFSNHYKPKVVLNAYKPLFQFGATILLNPKDNRLVSRIGNTRGYNTLSGYKHKPLYATAYAMNYHAAGISNSATGLTVAHERVYLELVGMFLAHMIQLEFVTESTTLTVTSINSLKKAIEFLFLIPAR